MTRTDGCVSTLSRVAMMVAPLVLVAVPACAQQPRERVRAAVVRLTAAKDAGDSVSLVLARIINLDTLAYAKFNLHPRDTVYWWVGRRRGELVSVFISSARGARPWVSDLAIDEHQNAPYR